MDYNDNVTDYLALEISCQISFIDFYCTYIVINNKQN